MQRNWIFILGFLALLSFGAFVSAQSNETENNSTIINNTNISMNNTNVTIPNNNTTNSSLNNTNNTIPNNSTNSTIPNNSTNVTNVTNGTIINQTKCEAINNRVNGRIMQYNEGRDKHFQQAVRLRNKVSEIADKVELRGINASNLRISVSIMDNKIDKLDSDYALFIQKLENTRNFTCGHTQGEFQASLNEAKAQLRIVRADLEDIKDFYRNTVKEDLKEIKRGEKGIARLLNDTIEVKNQVKNKRNEIRNDTIVKVDNVRNEVRQKREEITEKVKNISRGENRS